MNTPSFPNRGLTHTRAVWLMVAVTLMWSIAGVVTRHLEHARSFEVTFWRSLFTVLSLLVILPAVQGRAALTTLRGGGRALWLSGLCWSVMFTAFMVAITLMPVANVLVTMAVGPLLTALFAWVFIGHHIAPRTWGAIVMAGLGIGWMYGSQMAGLPVVGTLVALCVPVAAAVNWTVVQHAQQHGHAVNLMPAVLIGAVLSSLPPCHWPGRCRPPGMTWPCWPCWGWCNWPFPACWLCAAVRCSRHRSWPCWACWK